MENHETAMCEKKGHHCRHTTIIVLQVLTLLVVVATLLLLPKIVRNEVIRDEALKMGGIENYERINKEVYGSPEFQTLVNSQINQMIQDQKAQIQMYSQASQQPQDISGGEDDDTGFTFEGVTGDEANVGDTTGITIQ